MSWLVFIIYPHTEVANLITRTKRQCETTLTRETPTTPPPFFHLSRVQMRAGGGLFSGFNAASTTSTLHRILTRAGVDLSGVSTRLATTTTSLVSKCEPEVDLSMVSMPLPPLPPPSYPHTSRRWIFLAFWRHHLPRRVFFLRYQRRRGGVKPTHRRVRMFSLLLGAPGAACNFTALFTIPQ